MWKCMFFPLPCAKSFRRNPVQHAHQWTAQKLTRRRCKCTDLLKAKHRRSVPYIVNQWVWYFEIIFILPVLAFCCFVSVFSYVLTCWHFDASTFLMFSIQMLFAIPFIISFGIFAVGHLPIMNILALLQLLHLCILEFVDFAYFCCFAILAFWRFGAFVHFAILGILCICAFFGVWTDLHTDTYALLLFLTCSHFRAFACLAFCNVSYLFRCHWLSFLFCNVCIVDCFGMYVFVFLVLYIVCTFEHSVFVFWCIFAFLLSGHCWYFYICVHVRYMCIFTFWVIFVLS